MLEINIMIGENEMAMNNETYFEFEEDFNGFTTIPNYILNDSRVSYKAVGIYVQILQYRNSGKHKIYAYYLSNYRTDRKTAVSSGIQELIKFGYIKRYNIRNEKGHIKGVKYVVRMKGNYEENNHGEHIENTTSELKSENHTSDYPTSENTTLKIKYNKNKIKNKENEVVVDAVDREKQLLDLYNSYKIQKRLMPQMKKLLVAYIDKIDLDLFEEIFMLASEDNVKSKYKYIKELLETFTTKGISTLKDYEKDCVEYKSKVNTKKQSSKGSKTQNIEPQRQIFKTRFHNVNGKFDNMKQQDIEESIAISQYLKFGNEFQIKLIYNKALENGINSISESNRESIINYACEKGLEIPN